MTVCYLEINKSQKKGLQKMIFRLKPRVMKNFW